MNSYFPLPNQPSPSASRSAAALSEREGEAPSTGDRLKAERLVFPVALSDGRSYEVVGHLYYQDTCRDRPLQVLVHGVTYTHTYWDIPPFGAHTYSYGRHMARQGYAVLSLDVLGTGESSRPDGDTVGLAEAAESVHQVIARMRAGGGAVPAPFRRVALVGHSNGAIIATFVQSTYGDADVLVNTAFVFTPHPLPVSPEDLVALLDAPYISLPPAMRAALFYDAARADPAVIEFDNAVLADSLPRAQAQSLLAVSADPSLAGVAGVTCPVLVQLGERDILEPAAYAESDAALYARAKSVTTAIVPGAGHALNGHLGAAVGWDQIDGWLRSKLVG